MAVPLAVLLVAPVTAGATVAHDLMHAKVARFVTSTGVTRGVVRFTSSAALVASLPDPRCPAVTAIRLVTHGEAVRDLTLPCAGWSRIRDGWAYKPPTTQAANGVTGVVVGSRYLDIRLKGPPGGVVGPLLHLEVGLRIDDHLACGRFRTFERNGSVRVLAKGATSVCRAPRPNLLLVVLDDARVDGVDRMPVFQSRIVGEGRTFPNAFTPHASCCPSRATMLTGLYALRHGTYQVTGPIGGADTFRVSGADQRTVAVALRTEGYRTGMFGKYLNDYATEAGLGAGGTFYVPPGWDRFWAFVEEHYGGLGGEDYEVVDEHGVVTPHHDHSSDAEYSTDVSAARLRSFVAEAHAEGRPFFAMWTPLAPHGEAPNITAVPAARHAGVFADLPLWRPPSWGEADVSDKPRWLQRVAATATPVLRAVTDGFRRSQYEALLAVDEQLGLILDQLEALGIDDDTMIVVLSDNGISWGEHGWWLRKGCPYDECQRVPFAIRWPRVIPPVGSTDPTLVANLDVAPTFADVAGATLAWTPDGRSLVPTFGDTPPPARTEYLIEHWRPARGDRLTYTGQPADGDRLRILSGQTRVEPRRAERFEFDAGDGVVADAIAVPLGADANASVAALAAAIRSHVPDVRVTHNTAGRTLRVDPLVDDAQTLVVVWEEVDRLGVLSPLDDVPDFLGLRDVAGGFAWMEYATTERELYDLTVDPWQLQNVADDPAYADVRATMAARLRALLDGILAGP